MSQSSSSPCMPWYPVRSSAGARRSRPFGVVEDWGPYPDEVKVEAVCGEGQAEYSFCAGARSVAQDVLEDVAGEGVLVGQAAVTLMA